MLVVSDEDFNQLMPVVSVLPITSLKPGRRVYPNEVLLTKGAGGLDVTSLALAHQIRTIAKDRLIEHLGTIGQEDIIHRTKQALRIHLNL